MEKKTTRCSKCRVPTPSGDSQCYACLKLEREMGKVDHHSLARCPYCGEVVDIKAIYEDHPFVEGPDEVMCDECSQPFRFEIHVSVYITSEARCDHEGRPLANSGGSGPGV
jgi:hypothetical protein